MPVLERMENPRMPLLVHGEGNSMRMLISSIGEARFIDTVMEPLRQRLTALKWSLEHTTKDAAQYVRDGNDYRRPNHYASTFNV